MANTVGKISGPLLESNLIRQGENLAFETDLLFLNVNNKRVGINTDVPFRQLLVNDTIRTTNLIVDTEYTVPNFTLSENTISHTDGEILIGGAGSSQILTTGLQTDGLYFDGNSIFSLRSNEDIDLAPSGSGEIHFYNSVQVDANLHVTGDITFDGSITLGNDDTDNITFNADIGSNIIPDVTNTYDLGTNLKRWKNLYGTNVNGQSWSVTGGTVAGGVDISLSPGNIWFVAANGNNSNVGDHANGPFSTIEWALSQASSGDTVYIYPGTYVERFPLVVPQGVTVTGAGIRDVKIVPDTASQYEDVFKLNGETTVENLTVADFYYDSGLDKGYAFRFAPGFTVTSRSPYIRNISVITRGSTSTIVDGEYADATASVLLDGGSASTLSFSQIINGGAALFSLSNDSLGFDAGDAGRGALVDGSVVNASSNEASMLFHSVTFITPGVDAIVMKNGVRVEWLNSFIYYANRGLYAENGTAGFAGLGLRFGAEIRSIGSANVYGNYGAWGNGASVLMYLISHNFGYIGAGKDTTNDPTNTIESNEVVILNNAKIYYQSMDHRGDFKVGEVFKVNSATGDIVFQSAVTTSTNITVTDGTNISYIDAFEVSTGNITFEGNTIRSNVGGLNFAANNNNISVISDVSLLQSLTTNNLVANKNFTIGGSSLDRLAIHSRITTDLIPTSANIDIGRASTSFRNLYTSQLVLSDINIDTNVIKTTLSNSNLELLANGTGIIRISDSLGLGQNLTVSGNTSLLNSVVQNTLSTTSLVNATSITSPAFINDDIEIKTNYISTTLSNSNLELRANNTGGVTFESTLRITNSTISNILTAGSESQRSIIINPDTSRYVDIVSNSALLLPNGNDTNRILANLGEIRYNSTAGVFEGRVSGGTRSLYSLYDIDRNTSITPELTPGTNDNVIRMTIDGVVRSTFTEQRVQFDALRVDQLEFNNNLISTFDSNADIELDTSGTGVLNIRNNFNIDTGSITNIVNNAVTELRPVGDGYIKFDGTSNVRIPFGTTLEQPSSVPVGATRWNTDEGYLEVYNGSTWIIAAGGGATISAAELEDLSDVYALIFG
jgi:hypothetical protein